MLGVAVWLVAVSQDVAPNAAAVALAAAWGIQIAAFGALDGRLGRGRDATFAWVAGMAVRGAALLASLAAVLLDAVAREPAVVFGLGLVMLIILEVVWLAPIGTSAGSNDR